MLDELRKKSPYRKESYAFWGALAITGLVAAGWAVSLPIRLGSLDISLDAGGTEQAAGGLAEFIDQLKSDADAALNTATTTLPATDRSTWSINSGANRDVPANDPILIATSSTPVATSSNSIQIATSSEPTR